MVGSFAGSRICGTEVYQLPAGLLQFNKDVGIGCPDVQICNGMKTNVLGRSACGTKKP